MYVTMMSFFFTDIILLLVYHLLTLHAYPNAIHFIDVHVLSCVRIGLKMVNLPPQITNLPIISPSANSR